MGEKSKRIFLAKDSQTLASKRTIENWMVAWERRAIAYMGPEVVRKGLATNVKG